MQIIVIILVIMGMWKLRKRTLEYGNFILFLSEKMFVCGLLKNFVWLSIIV
jgi:hypothetical protein